MSLSAWVNKSFPGAILLLLAACAASDDEDPPLRIDVVEQEAADRLVAEALALGLTRRDSAGLIVSGVAQSWRVSEDGLSTVFRLRPARFAGGRDVTAADVVASIEDARRRGDPALRPLLAGIASVNAPLDDVVEIRLTTPQPELLELLADPGLGIRPRGRGTQAAAGLGAFQEAASRAPAPGDATRVLERNSAHLAGAAMSAELEIAVRSPEEALARFQRRTVDLVTGGGAAGFPAVRVTAPRESLRLEPSRAVLTLLLDHRSEPL
jgi:ABC-type transport system substrate-binding protein